MDNPNQDGFAADQKVGAGRFTLIRMLGKGGMGVVWLAHDERLREDVALKFLTPEIAHDESALEDMRRETLKSRKLSHPNIIRIHDLFEGPGEVPFISMEFVDGAPLSTLKSRQPERLFAWDQIKPFVQQLCSALEYAHGQKVIHRDLKPGNMMVDTAGTLKLADFGIAASASDSMSRLTQSRGSSGTPPYMSPQQMDGEVPKPSDDIYALGATLYELLTGRPPFYTGDIIHQVRTLPAKPLADRLKDFGLSNVIPPDVSAVIMACLSKDPSLRPQSAAAMAGWIKLDAENSSAWKDESEAPVSEPAGSSRSAPWLAVAVMVVACAALFIWNPWKRPDPVVANSAAPATNNSHQITTSPTTAVATATSGASNIVADPEEEMDFVPVPTGRFVRPPPDENGWIPLYTGNDLNGWTFAKPNGAWTRTTNGAQLDFSVGSPGNTRFTTLNNRWDDLELRFGLRFIGSKTPRLQLGLYKGGAMNAFPYMLELHATGDAVLQRSILTGQIGKGGRQEKYQWKLGMGYRGVVVNVGGRDTLRTVPLGGPKVVNKPDQWNQWLVRATKRTLTVYCNSRLVMEVTDNGASPLTAGTITMSGQPPDLAAAKAEFKDAFIRAVPAPAPKAGAVTNANSSPTAPKTAAPP